MSIKVLKFMTPRIFTVIVLKCNGLALKCSIASKYTEGYANNASFVFCLLLNSYYMFE